jgi:predicted lipoprotein with Yx(FWY)xxD motif
MRPRLLVLVVLAACVGGGLATSAAAGGSSATAEPTLTVVRSDFGRVLFDGSNRALYAFTRDPRGRSACYGACAAAWPPYIVRGVLRAGAGTKRPLLGTTRRRDGRLQLTYAGKPLYYYVSDPVGEILCQNVREFGGLWLVVRPSGALVR